MRCLLSGILLIGLGFSALGCPSRTLTVFQVHEKDRHERTRLLSRLKQLPLTAEKLARTGWYELLFTNDLTRASKLFRRALAIDNNHPLALWGRVTIAGLHASPTALRALFNLARKPSRFQSPAWLRLAEHARIGGSAILDQLARGLAGVKPGKDWSPLARLSYQRLAAQLRAHKSGKLPKRWVPAGTIRRYQRTVKPVSPWLHLDLDRAPTYFSGRSMQTRKTPQLLFSSGRGVYLVQLTLPTTRRAMIRINSANPLNLYLGGKRIARHRPLRGLESPVRLISVDLRTGAKQLQIVVAIHQPRFPLSIAVLPRLSGQQHWSRDAHCRPTDDLLALITRGEQLLKLNAAAAARICFGHAAKRVPGSGYIAGMLATALLKDETAPRQLRERRATTLLKQAVTRLKGAASFHYRLALRYDDLQVGQLARRELASCLKVSPAYAPALAKAHELLLEQGWIGLAQRKLQTALRRDSANCLLTAVAIPFYRQYRFLEPLRRLPRVHCIPVYEQLASLALHRGKLTRVERLYRQLLRARPLSSTYQLGLVTVLRLQKRIAEADRAMGRLLMLAPYVNQYRLIYAELAWMLKAAGKMVDRLLSASRSKNPTFVLHKQLSMMLDRRLLSGLRIDGRSLLKSYRPPPDYKRNGAVIVLKHQITRRLPAGDELQYVHHIVQLFSKQSLNRFGEVTFEDNPEILLLRTIKSDGSIRLPEQMASRDNWSMPGLEPGDFVEYAYLVHQPADRELDGRYIGEPFRFQHNQYPTWIARYDVLAPTARRRKLFWETSPGIPAPTIRNRKQTQHLRWEMRRLLPIRIEPLGYPAADLLPRVYVTTLSDWQTLIANLENSIAARLPGHPELDQLAQDLRRRHRDPERRLRAVYRTVLDRITHSASHWLSQTASRIWASKRGQRLIILKYLLDRCNIDSRIALVRPHNRRPGPHRWPALHFSYPLLQVKLHGRTVWLDPRYGSMPLGQLLPAVRGRPALVISRQALKQKQHLVKTPPTVDGQDRHSIAQELWIDPRGRLVGRGREVLKGYTALNYREFLKKRNKPARREALRRLLSRSYANVRITRLIIENLRKSGRPLVLRYQFSVKKSATGALKIGLQPEFLTRYYLREAERSQPLLVSNPIDVELQLTLHLSSKQSVVGGRTLRLATAFGSYKREITQNSERLVKIRRQLQLRHQRPILPTAYPRFRRFCAQADRADQILIKLSN